MLNEGIYEQIINTKIHTQLTQMDLSQYDIQLEKLDVEEARKILTIYISYIIQKGLKYIRDSYPSKEDATALLAQIKLCNDIIHEIASHSNESDFEDFQILEQGEILTSIYCKLNSVRALNQPNRSKKSDVVTYAPHRPIIRPNTSLLESTLFTGSKQEPNMLSEIKKEILTSDEVDILVSFVKWSGIRRIITELKAFTERPGTKLRIISSTYMKATDYYAIQRLANLNNTEVKINYDTSHLRMHAKSYLFKRHSGFSTVYIGSSNLSNPALTEGLEWNIKVTEQESFDIVKKCDVTFESYWNDSNFEGFDPNNLADVKKLKAELTKQDLTTSLGLKLQCSIKPYPYQQEILDNLEAERKIHKHSRNLVVASTGVGKTIIAAFDYKRFQEQHATARLLFIAHRKEILEQSIQKFREVLNDFNFGDLLVDGNRPSQIEHLFLSIQSFHSKDFTKLTTPEFYDFIIIDEFHHAAATSYQDVLSYYKPQILLGLTATPERHDCKNILDYFNGRIASEMRLVEAIDRKLLCPFHYFGVTDDTDYRNVTWRGKYDIAELEQLYTADEKRASMILKSVFRYVTDIEEVKGLGFCISVAHAEYMATYFNRHGVPSISLSAQSIDDIRTDAKHELVRGNIKFIFVVDLYNEGVDIPEVNTILFLRPTESSTVFLQQLGRGLRLHPQKECLTVLDFIGQAHKKYNFEHKFRAMIGATSKSVQHYVEHGFSALPKGSYIELEKMAQSYVLRNLQQCVINKTTLIEKAKYFEEETNLPLKLDYFLTYHGLSLYDFYQSNGTRSMYRLKQWANLLTNTADVEDRIYKWMSGLFHINSPLLLEYWIQQIKTNQYQYNVSVGQTHKTTQERIMDNMLYYTFYDEFPAKKGFSSADEGIQAILQYSFVKDEILEILEYNLSKVDFLPLANDYDYTCPLEIHCQYNTRQILAAYDYYNESQSPAFREGVKYLEQQKTDLFLINLNKSEKDFSPSTMYEDYAINDSLFHWQSQSKVSETSATAKRYIQHNQENTTISLFVRHHKKIGTYTSPYMFLGNASYVSHYGSKPVSFTWKLDHKLPANMVQKANKSIVV